MTVDDFQNFKFYILNLKSLQNQAASTRKFMASIFQKNNRICFYYIKLLILLIFLENSIVKGQNSCMPSSKNDGIFVGSSSLTSGMIKPGINTFAVVPGILQSLVPTGNIYDSKQLQISHCFRDFIAQSPYKGYEMTDFSFHSIVSNGTKINFLFLWNKVNSSEIRISLNFQFLLVYGKEEFLMGSFVIDTVQFLLTNVFSANQLNFSRTIKFKDYSPQISIPNQLSTVSVNLFVVGMRFLSSNVGLYVSNERYDKNSSQLSFSINLNNSNELYLIHLSYVIFDRSYLSSRFKVFTSWNQLANQDRIDYWLKGVRQINFRGFETGNILVGQLYMYKIDRLKCFQNCSSQCISSQNCQRLSGFIRNDSQCYICQPGSFFNSSTLKCQSQSICHANEILSNNQCVCKPGFVRIGLECGQCAINTVYNQLTKKCDTKCKENQTLINSSCVCKQGFYIINGNCSKCSQGQNYDSLNKKCISQCSAVQFYNSISKNCQCIIGFYRINGFCGKCAPGYVYNSSSSQCMLTCGQNKVFINFQCQCLPDYVLIQGICSKCPFDTIYNSLTQSCSPICTGNKKILNGKCICMDGFYEIGNECGICPSGSVYDSYLKNCIFKPVCKQNEVIINNQCLCNGPYINSICYPCPQPLIWNTTSRECIINCPSNSFYNSTLNSCVCNSGFYVIGGKCDTCPEGYVYDFAFLTCQSGKKCTGSNQVYFLGLCICDAGYLRIKGQCAVCQQGTKYNDTLFDCLPICGLNQIYANSAGSCQCDQAAGFYNISGSCQKCPANYVYNETLKRCETTYCPFGQININGTCSCPIGFFLIGNNCGLCDIGTIYNKQAQRCDKICPDPNGYYLNGKCFCYPPYVVINSTLCQLCSNGTVYDLQTLACKNTTINPSNQNLTCHYISEIRLLNQTSGQYYCACNEVNKYFFIYDRCATCQIFTKYNPDTKSCQLDTTSFISNIVNYDPNYIPIIIGNSSNKNLSTVQNSTSSCLQNQVWNRTQCVCVQNYFKIDGICTKCPELSYFNGSACVCQYGFFASAMKTSKLPESCLKCHQSCASCSGQNENQCLSCSNISHTLSNGLCNPLSCDIGYYLFVSSTISKCEKCSSYCEECRSQIECKKCINGFYIQTFNITQKLSVKLCSEICGDGKRFESGCDDNNSLDGDGCNKNCQIQPGWTCVGGSPTNKDTCSVVNATLKSIISLSSTTITKGKIIQNIRLSYLPEYFLKNDCYQCNKVLKVTITQAKLLPDEISIQFIPKSKYQFSLQFKFNDILSIPPFKFGVQINPEFKNYFSAWDMNQFYEATIDPTLLSLKFTEDYLKADDFLI